MESRPHRRHVLAGGLSAAFAAGGFGGSALFAQQDRQQRQNDQQDLPVVAQLINQAYQDGQYALPPLPYPYDALEPHIDATTMKLHHDVHHQGYVNGLNKTLTALKELRGPGEVDAAQLEALQRNLTFNGGGHLLHTIFWGTMSPDGDGQPQGPVAEAINRDFGSFDQFRTYFSNAATSVKGSGWGILAYEPVGDRLVVFGTNDHDLRMIAGSQPLLPLDVWEHAYYLKYQSKRGEYVQAWWNVVNWDAVNKLYQWVRSRYRGSQPQGQQQQLQG